MLACASLAEGIVMVEFDPNVRNNLSGIVSVEALCGASTSLVHLWMQQNQIGCVIQRKRDFDAAPVWPRLVTRGHAQPFVKTKNNMLLWMVDAAVFG